MRRLVIAASCWAAALAVTAAETAPPRSTSAAGATGASRATGGVTQLVDLNAASKDELARLPGVDAALAAKIIANRPYLTKTELVTKGVMPAGPFASLRHQVVAMPPKPAAKARTAARSASGPAATKAAPRAAAAQAAPQPAKP